MGGGAGKWSRGQLSIVKLGLGQVRGLHHKVLDMYITVGPTEIHIQLKGADPDIICDGWQSLLHVSLSHDCKAEGRFSC